MKVALIQVNLGDIDNDKDHVSQSIPYDIYKYNNSNFEPRQSLTPRLQAKIPKLFGWELNPGYDFYLYLDANITLASPDALEYLIEQIQDNDIVVLRHPGRPNIRQEVRYTRKGINQESMYMLSRYKGEFLKEMYDLVQEDKDFVDDLLVNGGVFLYRNTEQVQSMMKEWWYYITRYIVQDQIPFPYVLKKSGIKVKVLDHVYDKWNYLSVSRHKNNRV